MKNWTRQYSCREGKTETAVPERHLGKTATHETSNQCTHAPSEVIAYEMKRTMEVLVSDPSLAATPEKSWLSTDHQTPSWPYST